MCLEQRKALAWPLPLLLLELRDLGRQNHSVLITQTTWLNSEIPQSQIQQMPMGCAQVRRSGWPVRRFWRWFLLWSLLALQATYPSP